MPSMLRHLRVGTRSLIKTPTLVAVAVVALGFGTGLTTMMFSIIYGAMMKGLPFDEPKRIVSVASLHKPQGGNDDGRRSVSYHDYIDYRAGNKSLTDLAGYSTGTVNVSGTEKAERFSGGFVTANLFKVLRVSPILGRTFQEGDDRYGAAPVVVIGYQIWRDRYNKDPNIIGKSARVMGVPSTIIGVMPEKFLFPNQEQIWVPIRFDFNRYKRGEGSFVDMVGRLRPGVSYEQAASQLTSIAKALAKEYPQTEEGVIGASVGEYTQMELGNEPRRLLFTMLGAVIFVLLIACANVANLLLDRAAHRSKEVGIRTALGASRWQVTLQFLAEAFVLAMMGSVLGTVLGWVGVKLFVEALRTTEVPFWIDIRLHPPVLLFVAATALLSALVSGALPALQASRMDINEILKDESRGSSSMRVGKLSRALVVFEIALSCGLLVAAGLMIKSVTKLRNVDLGYPTTTVFTSRIGLPEDTYPDSTKRQQFFEQVAQRVATVPEVTAAGLSTNIPGANSNGTSFTLEGKTYPKGEDLPNASQASVTPGYFDVFKVKLLEGRLLNDGDRSGTLPVAVVNRSFVTHFFAGQSPLGRRIRFGPANDPENKNPWLTIVGVVSDAYMGRLNNERPQGIYTAVSQSDLRFLTIVARTRGAWSSATNGVRNAVASVDQDIPLYWVYSQQEQIARSTWFYRVFGTLFIIFGIIALFLAAVGLYAVMAFSVSRRTREVGVRMALGARSRDVMNMIFRQGMVQITVGMVIGLAFASLVSKLLEDQLFDVKPRDPGVFILVVGVLAATAIVACLVPARRATKIDPMIAMRVEG